MLAKTNAASIEFICTKYATRLHSFTKSLGQYACINKLLLFEIIPFAKRNSLPCNSN